MDDGRADAAFGTNTGAERCSALKLVVELDVVVLMTFGSEALLLRLRFASDGLSGVHDISGLFDSFYESNFKRSRGVRLDAMNGQHGIGMNNTYLPTLDDGVAGGAKSAPG